MFRSPVTYKDMVLFSKTVHNKEKTFGNLVYLPSGNSNYLMAKYVAFNFKIGTHWGFKQILLVHFN